MDTTSNSKVTLEQAIERDGSSEFLPTKVPNGQKRFVLTYGIPEKPTDNGTVAVIRLFGCYDSEKECEERAAEELKKQHCKVIRIEPTGNWIRLRDPRLARRDQYEHFSNNEIKKMVTRMNADLEKKEKEDEREMREEMQRVVKESQEEEDKDSVEYYMILREKINALPGLVQHHQHQVVHHTKEIVRLNELLPKHEAERERILAKHPDYNKRADDLVKTYKQA